MRSLSACGLRACALLLGLSILPLAGCTRIIHTATGIPSVSPDRLAEWLKAADAPIVLDVRHEADYRLGHIPGAVSIQPDDVEAFLVRDLVTPERTLVLVCTHGRLSAMTGAAAAARHRGPVSDLAGGMAAWTSRGLPVVRDDGAATVRPGQGRPAKVLDVRDQTVALVSGVVIKPLYMTLCLGLIVVLWRCDGHLRTLRRGLVAFLTGEVFCALSFYLDAPGVIEPLDLVHGAGMVAMGALAPWALLRLVDDRVLHYGEPDQTCAVQRFCGGCWKRQHAPCGLHRLFLATLPALAVFSLMPLSTPLRPSHYGTRVFGSAVDYGAPLLNALVEWWGYGAVGAACFLAALLMLRGGPRSIRRAELPFFAGVGFGSFAVFRFLLQHAFASALHWADFWEEVTELVAISSIGFLLLFFRAPLFEPRDAGIPGGHDAR